MLYGSGEIGKSNDDSGGGVDSNELYKEKVEPVLDSFSDLYLLLDSILVRASGTLLAHLTLFTDYLIYQLLLSSNYK